ncbi:splicing factor 45-like [Saccoglossus kowalevskii]|uniref:Splicing factor 45 n=1 Tax=Saccoglossus kowalevskii TaxID=10224 RepID=A0ABM0ML12_SACKO|nr:PREDICTED: splicing factor 45-like isoform X1 [Saccoglossus kowalevskii]XP_006820703.1 PREDICTED: splicing factor 45-like isoform X2 [Saccoglossus kowalevskii]
MSLYDGLGLDTGPKKEDTPDAKKSDLAGWSTGIRLMQSQLRIKKAALTEAQRRIRHTTLPPVVDLKKSNEEKSDFMPPPQLVYSKPPKPPVVEEEVQFSKPSPFITGGEQSYPDANDEYNPLWPNEYEKIIKAKRERRQKERELERQSRDVEDRDSGRRREKDRDRDRDRDRERGRDRDRDRNRDRRDRDQDRHRDLEMDFRDRSPKGFSRKPDSEDEYDFEERDKARERRRSGLPSHGAAIAPPASLIQEDFQANNDNEDRFIPPSKPLLERPKPLAPKSLVPSYDADPERATTPPPGSSFGNMSPPPPSIVSPIEPPRPQQVSTFQAPIGLGAGSVAAKIMAKYGFKEGQGLGKSEQGMSSALQVEKTSKRGGKIIAGDKPVMPVEPLPPPPPPPQSADQMGPPKSQIAATALTEAMRNPSKVVLLRNMVGPGEVDDDLEPETAEECTKYGKVTRVLIFEIPGGAPDEAVRIFVEFERLESAIKAVVDLNGRYFGGRTVKAGFFDPDRFKRYDLAPS